MLAKPLSARTTYGQWCAAINKRTTQLLDATENVNKTVCSAAQMRFAQNTVNPYAVMPTDIYADSIAHLHLHIANSNMPYRNESIAAYYDMPTLHYCMLMVAMYERYALHSYCEHGFGANLIAKRILLQEIGHDIASLC